jgi:hypothetical protein
MVAALAIACPGPGNLPGFIVPMTDIRRRLLEIAVDDHWTREGRIRAVRAVEALIVDAEVKQLFQDYHDEPLDFLDRLQSMKRCSPDVAEVVYVVMTSLLTEPPVESSEG